MDSANRKYLDVLDQWEQEPMSFHSLSAKRLEAVSSASELSQLKDYVAKLKFNYVELEMKRIFLQQLRSGGLPSRHAIQHHELEMEESKKKLKDLKVANEKLANDITALVSVIADGYAEFEKDKKALLKELEVYQQMQEARAASLEQALVPRHLTQQINNYQTANHAMLALCGFEVRSVSANVMRVVLRFDDESIPLTALTFTFAESQQLSDLSPALVPFEDLLEEALRANVRDILHFGMLTWQDAAFLIRETHARITNAFAAKKEIAELQTSISLSQEADTLTARFGSAAVMFKLSIDYPQPYARILVVRIDGVEKAASDAIRTSINTAPVVPLKQVIAAVQERLEGAKVQ